jgi:uncharacterized protein (DUF1499 family)
VPEAVVSRLGLVAVVLGLGSLALMAASVLSFRAGWQPFPTALGLATTGAWAALAGAVAGLAGLVLARRGRLAAALGLLLSLPVLVMAGAWEYAARTTPPINDIATDPDDPPMFWATETPTEYPPANAAPQRAAYPDVAPLDLALPPDRALALALALVEARGWEALAADPEEGRIEAIARSRLYGFADEVAIRLTETEAGTRVDMRSRSRLGRIDRGANAARIAAFLGDLEARATE